MIGVDELSEFWIHSVTVETYSGDGAYGAAYGAPTSVACFVDDSVKLVRNNAGVEVVASTTVYAPLAKQTIFAPESRVTLTSGKITKVIMVNGMDGDALSLPSHVVASLQ